MELSTTASNSIAASTSAMNTFHMHIPLQDSDATSVVENEEFLKKSPPQSNIQLDLSLGITTPAPTDIVCGRGKMTIAHPGNRRFRKLVIDRKDDYQKARRRDHKTRITLELVHQLRSGPEGGRFLLYDQNTKLWYDVGDDYAREKVSHSLRSRPNEQRRVKPKPRKKAVRETQHSPYLDALVRRLIKDQQELLQSMISKESNHPAIVDATRQP